nr:uncharacterized protein LOC108017862 isoform X3 [Drosophila suzukii]
MSFYNCRAMASPKCRVCLSRNGNLVNVNIISQFSCSKNKRRNSFPLTICTSCLHKGTQSKAELVDDVEENKVPHEEPFQFQVKNGPLNEDIFDYRQNDQFKDKEVDDLEEPHTKLLQVKNEPLQDDEFEEENILISSIDIEELVDEVKIEEIEYGDEEIKEDESHTLETHYGEKALANPQRTSIVPMFPMSSEIFTIFKSY